MTQWPTVSIVVPVFNGSRTIGDLVRSLVALDYPHELYEIIIVDNNSRDDTVQKVQQYPVKLLHECKVQSSYAARNRGVRASQSDIIAFTDADCVVATTWLRHLLADYSDPRWGGFAGGLYAHSPRTYVQRHLSKVGYLTLPSLQQPFFGPSTKGERFCSRFDLMNFRSEISLPLNLANPPTANVAYRREVFEAVDFFDVRLTSCGDVDFAWRVQTQTHWRIKTIPEATVYHQHRQTPAELIRLYRKNGWGYALAALKHARDAPRVARWMGIENCALIALTIPKHVLIFFTRLLQRPLRDSDELYLRSPLFSLLASVSYYYGRLSGARKGNTWLSQNQVYGDTAAEGVRKNQQCPAK
jgi:cellulose synthase/poly-beta-1,6-N-acetylglucosamine synthase-like glycosyltransferase